MTIVDMSKLATVKPQRITMENDHNDPFVGDLHIIIITLW